MPRLYLVRHGRATAGWNVDPDPGLDDLGLAQAKRMTATLQHLGPLPIITSPLARCQQTAAPLAQQWQTTATIEPIVAEIPSPIGVPISDRVEWLRGAMSGSWADLGQRYVTYRDGVADFLTGVTSDRVIVSHFVAINAAIGVACLSDRVVTRSLDNCSVTVIDVIKGHLHLVEGGQEADTLIR